MLKQILTSLPVEGDFYGFLSHVIGHKINDIGKGNRTTSVTDFSFGIPIQYFTFLQMIQKEPRFFFMFFLTVTITWASRILLSIGGAGTADGVGGGGTPAAAGAARISLHCGLVPNNDDSE